MWVRIPEPTHPLTNEMQLIIPFDTKLIKELKYRQRHRKYCRPLGARPTKLRNYTKVG